GLTTPELIRAIEILRAAGKVEAANLFHFHVGSQLTDIRTVKDVVNEGARFYAKLRKMGLSSLEYFDVGGGLGVDYVGARSTAHVSSLNYSMEEYAADVVYTVQQICNNEGVPEPNLLSEIGRAPTAHHACLLMNVFGHIEFGENGAVHEEPPASPGPTAPNEVVAPVPETVEAPIVREMREIVSGMTPKNSGEAYNDAVSKKEQALTMFKLGILG